MTDGLPEFFEKRAALHEASDRERLLALADRFVAEGAPDDALDFLQAAGAPERIAAFATAAARDGDPFLLMRIERISGTEVARETWEEAFAAAERSGRRSLAALGRRYLAAKGLS